MSDSPSDILENLNADELRRRLDALDRDRAALIVLLRAARARERVSRRPRQKAERQEVAGA